MVPLSSPMVSQVAVPEYPIVESGWFRIIGAQRKILTGDYTVHLSTSNGKNVGKCKCVNDGKMTSPWNCLLYIFQLFLACLGRSPHFPARQTWEIINPINQRILSRVTSQNMPPLTWFPELFIDFCQLGNPSSSSFHYCSPATPLPPGTKMIPTFPIYGCPGFSQPDFCGGLSEGFCAIWGCETIGTVHWVPKNRDLIQITSGLRPPSCILNNPPKIPNCNPLNISFTSTGKLDSRWTDGLTWGLRLYKIGPDDVVLMTIRLRIKTITVSVGPNTIFTERQPPLPPLPPVRFPSVTHTPLDNSRPHSISAKFRPHLTPNPIPYLPPASTSQRLLNLIFGTYMALNFSQPDKTRDCWLCLPATPPYYEAFALNLDPDYYIQPPEHCFHEPPKLTISDLSGSGLCLGKPPSPYDSLCNSTLQRHLGSFYLIAPNNTFWACNTGLTKCIIGTRFNFSSEFCILISLWPRITYHYGPYALTTIDSSALRYKREVLSLSIITLLGLGGIATGISTGTTALVETRYLQSLHTALIADLEDIEKSVTALEKSLTSLSEVVLQNRRGLDLLFLKEGGLCVALKEECCFYADHTGIARESMAKLRERLAQKKREAKAREGWFNTLLKNSPWLSTLIPTIITPLLILILALTFGPWGFQHLTKFIKSNVDSALDKFPTVQCHRIQITDAEQPHDTRLHFNRAVAVPEYPIVESGWFRIVNCHFEFILIQLGENY
ncbi:MLV-related proviral Env polyprotein-like [Gracilinanus agilis]|uniref:MLV-related proviral Env polyprotein-like n=1 Tax=Gracilinanus agilis TaxID=191870 RepID=UPI001CFDFB7E|nr:MLV-related proviral Env polyprotein-like [Gracilinanus agilis]